MSGKSRRRGRKLSRSQRRKAGKVTAAPVAPVAPIVESTAPTAQKPTPTPAPTAPTPVTAKAPAARATAVEPPQIAGELKRIGVVGGIVVALLVAAYFVLPLILD